MDGTTPMVCWFQECNKDSVDLVGGKCSSLGELINAGVRVPPGFALTTHGFRQFMRDAGIQAAVGELLTGLDHEDMDKLEEACKEAKASRTPTCGSAASTTSCTTCGAAFPACTPAGRSPIG